MEKYVLVCVDMRGEYVDPIYDVYISDKKDDCVKEMMIHFSSDCESVMGKYAVLIDGNIKEELGLDIKAIGSKSYEELGSPMSISLVNGDGEAITYKIMVQKN